jgi:hypothetical protein
MRGLGFIASSALLYTASAYSDTLCARGLKVSSGSDTVCCPAACGTCGGDDCADAPGGSANCCIADIVSEQRSCAEAEAPCVVDYTSAVEHARTLTVEEHEALVLQMNALDEAGVLSSGAASVLTDLTDVIVYSSGAPTFDLDENARNMYLAPVALPHMEPLVDVVVPPPHDSPCHRADGDDRAPCAPPMPPAGALRSCYGGQITDLDAYYKCTMINGGLFIMDLDVTSLDQLRSVQTINGPLVIEGNKNLGSIEGLESVSGHVESISIYENPQLRFVDGLEGVDSSGAVMIQDNEELVKLDALAHVCGELEHGLAIRNNPSLVNLNGLSCLQKIGAADQGVAVEIDGNAALENIEALNNVQELEGAAIITNNRLLESVAGLRNVDVIGKDVHGTSIVLRTNDELRSCDGFTSTTTIEGSVEVYDNKQLRTLQCLLNVQDIGANDEGQGVSIAQNPALYDAGLDDLVNVAGSLVISDSSISHLSAALLANVGKDKNGVSLQIGENHVLTTTALKSLQKVPGAVQMYNNDLLQSSGLYNLFWVGADVHGVSVELAANSAMQSTGLGNLQNTEGGIAITENTQLTSTDLLSLVSVGGSTSDGNCLEIVGNTILSELDAAQMTSCAGGMTFTNNDNLHNLGVSAATFVGRNNLGQTMVVTRNGALQTLEGFPAATAFDGSVVVTENPSLTSLMGAEYLNSIGADEGGDSLEIASNAVLESVAALKNAKTYAGALSIQANPKLQALDGLGVQSISGSNFLGDSILVDGNVALQTLHGLSNLHGSMPGAISITNNGALESVAGLENIQGVNTNIYGNSVEIIANKRLTDLTGLGLSGIVNGSVVISGNEMLSSLQGLCGIYGITGQNAAHVSLDISDNKQLVDAECLSNLGGVIEGDIDLSGTDIGSLTPLVQGDHPLQHVLGNIRVDLIHCLPETTAIELMSLCTDDTCRGKIEQSNTCSWTGGTDDNVYIGSGNQAPCGGTSGIGWHDWTMAGSSGLYIDVDTTECDFKLTPGYVTSVQGDAGHWQLIGVNSIYSATKDGFRVYVWHPQLRGSYLQYFAKRYNWRVNWVADSSAKAGVTRPGNSGWKQFAKDTVYVDVDTTKCDYDGPDTPSLVTALHGSSNHWRTQGVHSIYMATKTGFRVYVSHAEQSITPAEAEANKWAVAWIGSQDTALSGFSDTNWQLYCGDHNACQDSGNYFALYMEVSANVASEAGEDVTYVTSVSGSGPHLLATGGASLYRPRSDGFRVYLSHAPTAEFATANGWKVNWLAYTKPRDCTLAENWGEWTDCSQECGGGTQVRTKEVLESASANGYCPSHREEKPCNDFECVEGCQLSDWTGWGDCSVTCGHGSKTRDRQVTNSGADGGMSCPPRVGVKLCQNGPCPVHCEVSPWTPFSPCTAECDGGWKVRSRKIIRYAESGGYMCPNLTQKQACGQTPCPVDCKLGNWTEFGECSKECGTGMKFRSRPVIDWPQHGGQECDAFQEGQLCNEFSCDAQCTMEDWDDWSECSVSCGVGVQSREREVKVSRVDNQELCPHTHETKECFEGACPVHCEVDNWGKWSRCNKECGGGIKARSRVTLRNPKFKGNKCPPSSEVMDCNEAACDQDCQVGQWSGFTTCTKTCGRGTRVRDRAVVQPQVGDGAICLPVREEEWCNPADCPVDCEWGDWGQFDGCDATCGFGHFTRTRERDVTAKNDGAECAGSTSHTAQCILQQCEHPCPVSDWGSWTDCPAECGVEGKQMRTRSTDVDDQQDCPDMEQDRDCDVIPCDVDCVWSEWGEWSECSKDCGNGQKTQTRSIVTAQSGQGQACGGESEATAHCGQPCPVDCLVGDWTDYGPCSTTCGPGRQTKTRPVLRAMQFDGVICPTTSLSAACEMTEDRQCPVDCVPKEWNNWGGCSKDCGGGYETRTRGIETYDEHNGAPCPATEEDRQCNWVACPIDCQLGYWGGWSTCSVSCGLGSQTRTRSAIVEPQFDGADCAHTSETRSCDRLNCPVHCDTSEWSDFDTCTKDCQGLDGVIGRKTRTRSIIESNKYGGTICPILEDVHDCNPQPCPIDCVEGYWSGWGNCTRECGTGIQKQTRKVIQARAFGGDRCEGPFEDTQVCNTHPCDQDCVISNWAPWSACQGACDQTGTRSRTRVIWRMHVGDGTECGVTEETDDTCQMDRCPHFCDVSNWGGFSNCTAECNGGTQYRTRSIIEHDDHSVCPNTTQTLQCNTEMCAEDCEVTNWGSWLPYLGGGKTLKRTRQEVEGRTGNALGEPCPTEMEQYEQNPDWCSEGHTVGAWTGCFTGYQYRDRDHRVCSDAASLKYHMVFRQGRHCTASAPENRRLSDADLLDLTGKEGTWRALSMQEVRQFGLPVGHWQQFEY